MMISSLMMEEMMIWISQRVAAAATCSPGVVVMISFWNTTKQMLITILILSKISLSSQKKNSKPLIGQETVWVPGLEKWEPIQEVMVMTEDL
jgi:hypothetical protein